MKILKWLFIVQTVSNKGRTPKIGRGFQEAMRFNPWNPLSYPIVLIMGIGGLLAFGLIGFWKRRLNPFKWD